METFYSIVKIAPNRSAGDSLSIGLLLRDKSGFRFRVSDNKKRAAKHLLYENNEAVDFIVRQLDQKIREANSNLKKNGNSLFNIQALLSSDYFSYLSNYNNGILQFSKPALLDDEVTESKFAKLFEILVDRSQQKEEKSTEAKEQKFIRTVEKKLITRVKDKVHTHLKIDHKVIPSLYYQFEIDCIGLNGTLVGAKSLSFTKSPQTLDTQISHFTNLITFLSLSEKKKIDSNKFYLIADEPAKVDSPEHKIWDTIQKQELFKVISSEEADTVAQVVEDTKAGKFLEV